MSNATKTPTLTSATVENFLKAWQSGSQKSLEKWNESFASNPGYALEWVSTAMLAAARVEVATRYLTLIEGGRRNDAEDTTIVRIVGEQLSRDIFNRAINIGGKSSSEGANMMQDARLEVVAKLAQWFTEQLHS